MMFQTLASQKAVYNMNYVPPKLYGQLKSHKQGYPLRPVVAFYTDSTYKLGEIPSCMVSFAFSFLPYFHGSKLFLVDVRIAEPTTSP